MTAKLWIVAVLGLALLLGCGETGGRSDADDYFRKTMDAINASINACEHQVGLDDKHYVGKMVRCIDHGIARSERPDE